MSILRQRRSAKWEFFGGADTLPLPIAEADVHPPQCVKQALHRLVDLGDTGYSGSPQRLFESFSGFARRRWGWETDPTAMVALADVGVGIVEPLRAWGQELAPDACRDVVLCPPVYAPFPRYIREAGLTPLDVPLLSAEQGYRLDLEGICRALENGACAVLLCHPHNPVGVVHSRAELIELASLAAEHSALVVSDEVHAPLVLPDGPIFHPYLTLGSDAERTGICVTSASKTWNIAGLKCAISVAGGAQTSRLLRNLPFELGFARSHFGVVASEAAFAEGEPWLDEFVLALQENVNLLDSLLSSHLPQARWQRPDATFLAWVDLSSYGHGGATAEVLSERGKVAFSSGPDFGFGGTGFVRINLACSPELLTEAIERAATALQVISA